LAKRSPSFWRHAVTVQYESKTGVWPGYRKRDNFAVRWTGFLLIMSNDEGTKCTFKLRSDDGSKLWIDKKLVINNGGLHPARNMNSRQMKLLKGQHTLRMEYFEKGGHAAFLFFWKNKATKFKFKRVTKDNMGYHIEKGFREEVFYLKDPAKKMMKLPYLNNLTATTVRVVPFVHYKDSDKAWPGFAQKDNFAARWSGILTIGQEGPYRFSLTSDDGSKMYLGNRRVVNNDGLHAIRRMESTVRLKSSRYRIIAEYFEKMGHAAMMLKYMGPDTQDKMAFVGEGTNAMRAMERKIRTPKIVKKKPVLKKKAPQNKVR
jgi:hypothetical protein